MWVSDVEKTTGAAANSPVAGKSRNMETFDFYHALQRDIFQKLLLRPEIRANLNIT